MTDEELRYYSNPKMQEKFNEMLGKPVCMERLLWPGCVEPDIFYEGMDDDLDDVWLRLPLPIDPVNPERGLWGMLDWSKWHLETQEQNTVIIYAINDVYGKLPDCEGVPTLALLKALAYQWGVEVNE